MSNSTPCSSVEIMPTRESAEVGRMEKEAKAMPVGFYFYPTDREIFQTYLINKILNRPLSSDVIGEIDVFKHDPEQLPQCEFRHGGKKIAYFFTLDKGKDSSREGTRRATPSGYWEINGKEVVDLGPDVTGFKPDSAFYEVKGPEGIKTRWRMTQYRVKLGPAHSEDSQFSKHRENYSVCKIWSLSEEEEEEEEELWEKEEDSSNSDSETEES